MYPEKVEAYQINSITKEEAYNLIRENPEAFSGLSDNLKSDQDIVRFAMQAWRYNINFAGESIKDNEQFLLELSETYPEAVNVASERLKQDLNFVLTALKYNKDFYYELDQDMRINRKVMRYAAFHYGISYEPQFVDYIFSGVITFALIFVILYSFPTISASICMVLFAAWVVYLFIDREQQDERNRYVLSIFARFIFTGGIALAINFPT